MRVLISGGGTAGHINPGIAIAEIIKTKNKDAVIEFVGTEKGLESTIVPKAGYKLHTIRVAGFKRKLGLDTLKTFKLMFDGYADAKKIIKEFNPDIVIGTGGYVCGPLLFASSRKKIPTLIHEQNAFAGVTNKILSKFVDTVCISFKESINQFSNKANTVFTGNPVRPEILKGNRAKSRETLSIAKDSPLVVAMGGSRGAERINEVLIELIKKNKCTDYNLIWATGSVHYEKIIEQLGGQESLPGNIKVVDYLYNMADIFAAADLMVCRAGAITVTEIGVTGTPSILIPSPYVTANHQEYNARALSDKGGAVLLLEKDLSLDTLTQKIDGLLKSDDLISMAKTAKSLMPDNATEMIYKEVVKLTGK